MNDEVKTESNFIENILSNTKIQKYCILSMTFYLIISICLYILGVDFSKFIIIPAVFFWIIPGLYLFNIVLRSLTTKWLRNLSIYFFNIIGFLVIVTALYAGIADALGFIPTE